MAFPTRTDGASVGWNKIEVWRRFLICMWKKWRLCQSGIGGLRRNVVGTAMERFSGYEDRREWNLIWPARASVSRSLEKTRWATKLGFCTLFPVVPTDRIIGIRNQTARSCVRSSSRRIPYRQYLVHKLEISVRLDECLAVRCDWGHLLSNGPIFVGLSGRITRCFEFLVH